MALSRFLFIDNTQKITDLQCSGKNVCGNKTRVSIIYYSINMNHIFVYLGLYFLVLRLQQKQMLPLCLINHKHQM
jgi:hypothetical protein